MRFITSLIIAAMGILIGSLMILPASAQKIKGTDKAAVAGAVTGRAPPADFNDKQNLLYLDLSTGGRVVIWLRPDVAPLMVERIKGLTRKGFYDGLLFHRVIDGFMAQTGDPKGDGTGGSDLPDLKAEFNYLPHVRGAVSAARATSEDSANSQFFIVFQPTLKLDRKYTVFGRVIGGMDYVDAVERGEPPAKPSRILHAYIAADGPPAYVPPAAAPVADLGPPVSLTDPAPAKIKPAPAKPAAKPPVKTKR